MAGAVYGEDLITSQNVKIGDYIRQYALIEFDREGAVYTVLCEDCTVYITLTDRYGNNIIYNKTMTELDTGLFGYLTNDLKYGELYNARYESVSAEYGNGIIYGEVQITDISEWIGAIDLDATTIDKPLTTSIDHSSCDEINDVMLKFACQTEGEQAKLENTTIPLLNWKIGAIGTVFFYISALFVFLYDVVVVLGGGVVSFLQTIIKAALDLGGFVVAVTNASTRDQAISNALKFFYNIMVSVMKPFLPFLIIGELFILYKVSVIKSGGTMMQEFFMENYRMVKGVINLIVSVVNTIMGIIGGIIPG